MATKIRLQRFGKKGKPFYHVVIADSRVKRDGKIIERIGSYNPNVNPAIIDIKLDRAVYWLETGAQPTETADRLLTYVGAKHKKHLNGGVIKGAFDQAEADKRFEAWLSEKEAKIQAKIDGLDAETKKKAVANLERERKIKEARLKATEEATTPTEEETTPVEEETAPTEEEATPPVQETTASVEETTKEEPPVTEASEEVPAKEE